MVIYFNMCVTCTSQKNKISGDLECSSKFLKSPIQLENSTSMSSYMNLKVQRLMT